MGGLGGILDPLGPSWRPSWTILGELGAILAVLEAILKPSWEGTRMTRANSGWPARCAEAPGGVLKEAKLKFSTPGTPVASQQGAADLVAFGLSRHRARFLGHGHDRHHRHDRHDHEHHPCVGILAQTRLADAPPGTAEAHSDGIPIRPVHVGRRPDRSRLPAATQGERLQRRSVLLLVATAPGRRPVRAVRHRMGESQVLAWHELPLERRQDLRDRR